MLHEACHLVFQFVQGHSERVLLLGGLLILVRDGVLHSHRRQNVATLLCCLLSPRRFSLVHLLHKVQSSHLKLVDGGHVNIAGHVVLLEARVDILCDRLGLLHKEIGFVGVDWNRFLGLSNVRKGARVQRDSRRLR